MADNPVKCSGCDVPAQVILEEDTPQKVVCPRCGASESYVDFQRSVGNQASAYASEAIGKSLKGCVRNPVQAGWSLLSMRWIMAT